MSLGSFVAQPANLQLEALVAKVASHSGSEDQLLLASDVTTSKGFVVLNTLQGCDRTVLTIAEDDELDAMETQLLFTNEGSSIVDTTILKIVEVVDDLLAA